MNFGNPSLTGIIEVRKKRGGKAERETKRQNEDNAISVHR
jgi:hypothetical protein